MGLRTKTGRIVISSDPLLLPHAHAHAICTRTQDLGTTAWRVNAPACPCTGKKQIDCNRISYDVCLFEPCNLIAILLYCINHGWRRNTDLLFIIYYYYYF